MLELTAGTYPDQQTGLRYLLTEDLRLPPGSCLYLTGENGAGKTSFLEHVFIPSLRGRHRFLYLAQDMDLQQNTIRATLALLGHDVPAGLADMAAAWVRASGCRELVILDEFDKYVDDAQLGALDLPSFTWAVQVTHLTRRQGRRDFANGFALRFTRPRPDGPDVSLHLERLWAQ